MERPHARARRRSGLRVVTVEGGPVRFRHAAIRGIFGVFEIYVVLGSVALLTIILTRRDQRLGDLSAGTILLRERTAPANEAVAVTGSSPRTGSRRYVASLDVTALTNEQYGVLRSFLMRVLDLSPEARGGLAVQAGQRHRPRAAPDPAARPRPRALPRLRGRRLPEPPRRPTSAAAGRPYGYGGYGYPPPPPPARSPGHQPGSLRPAAATGAPLAAESVPPGRPSPPPASARPAPSVASRPWPPTSTTRPRRRCGPRRSRPWCRTCATRYANPSGAHRLARAARRAIDEARDAMAELSGPQPGEVVFTSGGTEADNLAVLGIHDRRRRHGRVPRPSSTTPCSTRSWPAGGRTGRRSIADGRIDLDALAAAPRRRRPPRDR